MPKPCNNCLKGFVTQQGTKPKSLTGKLYSCPKCGGIAQDQDQAIPPKTQQPKGGK